MNSAFFSVEARFLVGWFEREAKRKNKHPFLGLP